LHIHPNFEFFKKFIIQNILKNISIILLFEINQFQNVLTCDNNNNTQFSNLYSINNSVSLNFRHYLNLSIYCSFAKYHSTLNSRTSLGTTFVLGCSVRVLYIMYVCWVTATHITVHSAHLHCFKNCSHSFRHEQELNTIVCTAFVITFLLLVPFLER
jgi:hypothetical protein